MKKLILLLILAGVIFGGKFYLENRYKKGLDQAINLARSQADISYSKLKIGFDGSINIHDLSFSKVDGPGSFTIKKLSGITSNRLAPLYGNIFKNGETPEWLKISAHQLTIDSTLLEPNPSEECTSIHTAFIYSEIDIEQIYANASIKFNFRDPNNAEAVFNYEDQASSMELILNFSVIKAQQTVITRDTQPINKIQLTSFIDPSFASQFNEYCAKKLDLETEKYLSDVAGSPKYSYDSFGYYFGDKVSEALGSYMKGGHSLSINSSPSEQLKKLSSASSLSRKKIIQSLNLKIKLDENPVLIKLNENSDFENKEVKKEEPLVIRSKRKKYQPELVSNIPKLIDNKVKIWRKGNKARIEGRIDNYANGIAFIEIRKHGGKAVYEIKVQEIQKIEVLR